MVKSPTFVQSFVIFPALSPPSRNLMRLKVWESSYFVLHIVRADRTFFFCTWKRNKLVIRCSAVVVSYPYFLGSLPVLLRGGVRYLADIVGLWNWVVRTECTESVPCEGKKKEKENYGDRFVVRHCTTLPRCAFDRLWREWSGCVSLLRVWWSMGLKRVVVIC